MKKESFTVTGMSCSHCEGRVVSALEALSGVKSAKASAKKSSVEVKFDDSLISLDAIKNAVTETGYNVG